MTNGIQFSNKEKKGWGKVKKIKDDLENFTSPDNYLYLMQPMNI